MPPLSRFLEAQETDYPNALTEIQSGKKRGHWMWYIFPQYAGLGYSETSKFYAIQSLEEARAYLCHPVLGTRLREITNALLTLEESNPTRIFGQPDDLKLQSCMTLFAVADHTEHSPFRQALEKFFGGDMDARTLALMGH